MRLRRRDSVLVRCLVSTITMLALTCGVRAEDGGYRLPPEALADLALAAPTPRVMVTPDASSLLIVDLPGLPGIAELAEPELRLAGLRINPRIDARSRTRHGVGLRLVRIADGVERAILGLPETPRIEHLRFSPDSRHLAFTQRADQRIELWVADLTSLRARRLSERALHLAAGIAPAWLDDATLVVTVVPADRPAPPAAPRVPSGPVVRENLGQRAQARTYQDLLHSPHDEALFAHHLRAQLARIALDATLVPIAEPALYWHMDPSPDGRYLLVETLHAPFSYLVPARRFPRRIAVLDRQGALVREIADLPLQESVPIAFGSVPTGPRNVAWRGDAAAALVWAEARDGGDARREATVRDRLFVLNAPFAGAPQGWIDLSLRLRTIVWSRDDLALVSSFWWKTRRARLDRVRPGDLSAPAERVFERSFEDRYSDPGEPVTVRGRFGREVLLHPAGRPNAIYQIGEGASPEGARPFLDVLDLASGKSERRFRSQAPYYERPIRPLGDGTALLTRRESVTEPPSYRLRSPARPAGRELLHFAHPAPQLIGLHKELITYPRADGVQLSGTLYLPPGYDAKLDGPLPMLMWAYPQEFKSAAAAAQVSGSPYRFDRISWRSPVIWLAQGYAVLDDPSMPIIGEGDAEPNDHFREQLVASAAAAVEEVVRRGVADRERIAIGGHSYGAFMTANLLAHSDLFAAGIARSGAYNRTLTPFGFQAEERTLWQAPEVYFAMSPFMHAEKVNEPILLIHGEADNNPGTFPIQSERFYHALKGHGAVARLVMLPLESHGYRARESILHLLWESNAWLEHYVKHAEPRQPPAVDAVQERRGER